MLYFSHLVAWLFLGMHCTLAGTASPDSLSQKYEDALRRQDWQEASTLLQESELQNRRDPNWNYNLGTLYLYLNRLSEARYFIERARWLDPFSSAISNNLDRSKQLLTAKIGNSNLNPADQSLEILAEPFGWLPVRSIFGLFFVLLTGVGIAQSYRKRPVLFPAIGLALCGLALLFAQLGELRPPAVVLSSSVIKSGPGEEFLELSKVLEGQRIRLTGKSSETKNTKDNSKNETWMQVAYAPDQLGWIKQSMLLSFEDIL